MYPMKVRMNFNFFILGMALRWVKITVEPEYNGHCVSLRQPPVSLQQI